MDSNTVVLEIQEHYTRIGYAGRPLPALIAETQLASSFGQYDNGEYSFSTDASITNVDYKYWFQKLHPFLLRLLQKVHIIADRCNLLLVCEESWSLYFSVGLQFALKELHFKSVYLRKSNLLPLLSFPVLDHASGSMTCAFMGLPGMTVIRFTPTTIYLSISSQGHLIAEAECPGGDTIMCQQLRRCIVGEEVLTAVEHVIYNLFHKNPLNSSALLDLFTPTYVDTMYGGIIPVLSAVIDNRSELDQFPFLEKIETQVLTLATLQKQEYTSHGGQGDILQTVQNILYNPSAEKEEVFVLCYACILLLSNFLSNICLSRVCALLHTYFNQTQDSYMMNITDAYIPFPIVCSIPYTQYTQMLQQCVDGVDLQYPDITSTLQNSISIISTFLQLLQQCPTMLLPSVSTILVCGSITTASSTYILKYIKQQLQNSNNTNNTSINHYSKYCQVVASVISPDVAVWTGASLSITSSTTYQSFTNINIDNISTLIKQAK